MHLFYLTAFLVSLIRDTCILEWLYIIIVNTNKIDPYFSDQFFIEVH